MSKNSKITGKIIEKDNFLNIKISYITIFFIILFCSLFFWFHDQINSLKNDFSACQQTTIHSENNDTKIFDARLSNLESKYIDVIATKETLNWWITVLAVLLPVTLGFFVYQKGKIEEKAERELKRVENLMKEAKEKIESLDQRAEQKIHEISYESKKEFDKIVSISEEKIKEIVKESGVQRNVSALFNKAIKYHKIDDYENALKYYNQILEVEPNDVLTLHNKGAALLSKEKCEESIEVLNNLLKIDPSYSSAYYNLGCAYSKLKGKIDAIENIEKAFQLGYFNSEKDRNHFYIDGDFDPIKDTPEFKAFLKKLEDKYGKPNSENQKTE